jgi:hypothetical protein
MAQTIMDNFFKSFTQAFSSAAQTLSGLAMNRESEFNPSKIDKLTPDMDKRRWFATYRQYQMNVRKVAQNKLVEYLPLYLSESVRMTFDALTDDDRRSLNSVQEALEKHYKQRIKRSLYAKLAGIEKRDEESHDAFGQRLEMLSSRLKRLGDPMPFEVLKTTVMRQVDQTYMAALNKTVEMAQLRNQLSEIDALEQIKKSNRKSKAKKDAMEEAGGRVVMMAMHMLQQMQEQLQTLKDNNTQVRVNSIREKVQPYLPHLKVDSSGGERLPKNPKHQNNECYGCGMKPADHMSWDCPKKSTSRRKTKGFARYQPYRNAPQPCATCNKIYRGRCWHERDAQPQQHQHSRNPEPQRPQPPYQPQSTPQAQWPQTTQPPQWPYFTPPPQTPQIPFPYYPVHMTPQQLWPPAKVDNVVVIYSLIALTMCKAVKTLSNLAEDPGSTI